MNNNSAKWKLFILSFSINLVKYKGNLITLMNNNSVYCELLILSLSVNLAGKDRLVWKILLVN